MSATSRGRGVLAQALIAALLLAIPAAAAARRVAGSAGEAPTVAVGPTGIAYVAWNTTDGVRMCVVPPRTLRCRPHYAIDDGNDAFAEPPLLRSPVRGVVQLVSDRSAGDPMLFTSDDGGAAFASSGTLGGGEYFGGAFGPGGELLLTDDEYGLSSVVTSLTAPVSGDAAHAPYVLPGSSAAAWVGGTPVIVGGAPAGAYAWHWSGQGSAEDPHEWIRQHIGADQHNAMASGPRGLFLLQDPPNLADPERLVLRHWRHGRFHIVARLPRRVAFTNTGGLALAQDDRGRLIAAWYAEPGDYIAASVSSDGGRRWTKPLALALHVNTVARMSLAVGRRGTGILAYSTLGGGVWVAPAAIRFFHPPPVPRRRHR